MKICLVPYPIIMDSRPDSTDQKRLYPYLPLGLLTLSPLLEQAGHEVTILDPIWETNTVLSEKETLANPERVARLIQAKAPDLVGFSTICSSYPLIIKWTESLHHLSPKTPILLGGPQATATDEQTLQAFSWIDMVLRGEAENSIIPLVTCLQSGGNLASVPGLTWRSDGNIVRNTDAPIVINLDNLPTPAYHLYPVEQLVQCQKTIIFPFHRPFPLEAGRGCLFNCSFCSTNSFFQRRYRTKSAERLVHEMFVLQTQYGLECFDLAHDLFTCNSAFILEFCHRLREKGLHKTLSWECYSRTDTVDQKVLAEMAAAGCSRIFYGIESGSQRMQKMIGKNLIIQQVKPVIQETLSLGIHVTASFICGFPQDRKEDLSPTLSLVIDIINMGVDQVVFLPLAPLPKTELFRIFGDTIHYDNQWSDMPFGYLSHEEQELVLDWPHVFTSFYHYETPCLNHDMLLTLLRMVNRYPRLLTLLSTKGINLISVFEQWPGWYHAHITHAPEYYYRQSGFFLDFLQFLQETLSSSALMTSEVSDIIHYYTTIERVTSAPEDAPIVSERFNCDVLLLIQYLTDGKKFVNEALQPTNYLFWKSNGKLIVERLTPALAELLGITKA